jgi:amidase
VIQINTKALEMADFLDRQFKVDAAGMATTASYLCLEGIMPDADAFITPKMKEAGVVMLAKVNLHEFAVWGETARTPGGSSGGTGAGIAANFGMTGIGTDTINSVRKPASACSLVGKWVGIKILRKTSREWPNGFLP